MTVTTKLCLPNKYTGIKNEFKFLEHPYVFYIENFYALLQGEKREICVGKGQGQCYMMSMCENNVSAYFVNL